jgi:beta-glucanase (GH16 family)
MKNTFNRSTKFITKAIFGKVDTSILAFSLCLLLSLIYPVLGDPIDPASGNAVPSVPEIAQKRYRLAFSDEFNGSTLDETKWQYRLDTKAKSSNLAANVSVSGGLLHLALRKEPANGKDYTSGGIISKDEFQYGYYEARFKCPPGTGWHTSFWTMHYNGADTVPAHGREEIDICEHNSGSKNYSCGLHSWGAAKDRQIKDPPGKGIPIADAGKDFHVWGMEFTPQTVNFYLDGQLVKSDDASLFTNTPGNIWLTSLGFGFKPIDDKYVPAEAVFDYIRFFAMK